jgi:hypothetical protein
VAIRLAPMDEEKFRANRFAMEVGLITAMPSFPIDRMYKNLVF